VVLQAAEYKENRLISSVFFIECQVLSQQQARSHHTVEHALALPLAWMVWQRSMPGTPACFPRGRPPDLSEDDWFA
jgi:hypothetical protein